ncbi:MAG: hypothetical protein NTU53_20095, partial [Planctomycetota bacterium]|nr:hypothetical protein [Planctomycetota bacterium]
RAVTWLKLRWLSRPTCDILASFFTAVSFVKITTGHCNVRGDSLSWDYRREMGKGEGLYLDLETLVKVWPDLSAAVKAGIMAMVKAVNG